MTSILQLKTSFEQELAEYEKYITNIQLRFLFYCFWNHLPHKTKFRNVPYQVFQQNHQHNIGDVDFLDDLPKPVIF